MTLLKPEANLAGLRGGIDNVMQNEKAMATVQKGMEVNSDLAHTVAKQTPAAAQRINQNTENVVNQALKQHIDVPQTVANRQEQFNNYLQQHSADEVLDATPVVSRYTAGDGIQTLKSIRKNMQKQEPDFKMLLIKMVILITSILPKTINVLNICAPYRKHIKIPIK